MTSIAPFIASAADLLSKVGTDDFKKLFKPAALVSAAVLLALHLLLIFPPLFSEQIPSYISLRAINPLWAALAISLALPVLSYVIDSLQGFFMDFLTGWGWRDSLVVGPLMTARQQSVFDSLVRTVQSETNETSVSTAASRLALEFPRDRSSVGPTEFGNVLRSTAAYTLHQYGMHLGTTWPLLELKLKQENNDLWERVRGGEDSVAFLAGLTFLIGMTGVEVAVVGAALNQPILVLWSVPVFAGAIPVYKAAIQRARALGREMRLAFDLYHELAAEQLQLAPVPTFEEGKKRWEKISYWLLHGGLDFKALNRQPPERSAQWFSDEAPAAKDTLDLAYPPNIAVKSSTTTCYRFAPDAKEPAKWNIERRQSFFFNISNTNITDADACSADAFLKVVHLDRTTFPIGEMTGLIYSFGAGSTSQLKPIAYGDKGLLWLIGRLSVGASRMLIYDLALEGAGFAKPKSGGVEIVDIRIDEAEKEIVIELRNGTNGNIQDPSLLVMLPRSLSFPRTVYSVRNGKPSRNIDPSLDGTTPYWVIPGNLAGGATVDLILKVDNI